MLKNPLIEPIWFACQQMLVGLILIDKIWASSGYMVVEAISPSLPLKANGKPATLSIQLSKEAVKSFNQHYNNGLFPQNQAAFLIQSDKSLMEDIERGLGALNQKPLRAVDFYYIPGQPIPLVKADPEPVSPAQNRSLSEILGA